MAPTGGPPDKTPPEIIATTPAPSTLNFREKKLAISFSKYVDKQSFEQSIFISPSLGPVEFDWGGKEVEVTFSDSLRGNTTYIMTVGTDLVDTRGNRLAKAFSLPFSTGDHIDSASIAGTVYDANPVGIMIYAYRLEGPDTLDPSHTRPAYLTQTGRDGTFVLPYLSFGTYRLIAVKDQYKDLIYDRQIDQYGMTTSDVSLTPAHSFHSGLQFRITSEDTTAPFLSSARSRDITHVLLRFGKSMDQFTALADSVRIVDTLSGKPLGVLDVALALPPSLEATVVTSPQQENRGYRVTLGGFGDIHGLSIAGSGRTSDFTGSAAPDTTRPVTEVALLRSYQNRAFLDDTLRIDFSKPVRRSAFEPGFSLKDSGRISVPGRFDWWSSQHAFFVPLKELKAGGEYIISIRLDSAVDYSGNPGPDSTTVHPFETVERKSMSSLEGRVEDTSGGGLGKIYLTAAGAVGHDLASRTVVLPGPGPFRIDHLVEGSYVLEAFRDADSNGVYSYGRPFPCRHAERFVNYPDTLKLRARWPLEGIVVKFP